MEQLAFFEIPSPCIGVCQSDSRGYCLGCHRSRDERFQWQQLTDPQKMEVIRLCRQRDRRRKLAIYHARKAQLEAERAQASGSLDLEVPQTQDLDLSMFDIE
jgi:uncharacterized protein